MNKPNIGLIDRDSPEVNQVWTATYAAEYQWSCKVQKAIEKANAAVEALLKACKE